MPIILASASPRRRALLEEHGLKVEIVPARIEETMPSHLTAGETTLLNAIRKASAVAVKRPDAVVIGADTLVFLEGAIFGKPKDMKEAFEMISRLNGREHQVFSGICLTRRATSQIAAFVEMSRVHFRKLKPKAIREYLKRIGPLDKAGAYAAQEEGTTIIERIEGSRTNVIGLPMERLIASLGAF